MTDAGLGSAIGRRDGDVYTTVMSWTRQLPINVAARERDGKGEGTEWWEGFVKPALRGKL